MTVSNSSRRHAYTGNGATTNFTVPFQFFEIGVYTNGVLAAEGSDYTITQSFPGNTGSITFAVAPAAGVSVVIIGATSRSQGVDYPTNGQFPAESTENALDRLTMIAQELERLIGTTIRQPVHYAAIPDTSIPVLDNVPVVSKAGAMSGYTGGSGYIFVGADGSAESHQAVTLGVTSTTREGVDGASVPSADIVIPSATEDDRLAAAASAAQAAASAAAASAASAGSAGWTGVLAIANDGARRVHRVVDWFGGGGAKPPVGQYVGPAGSVSAVADAVDVRGAAASDGLSGWTAVTAVVADAARRVLKVVDWSGGTGVKPAANKFLGGAGLVDALADAIDVRGPAGPSSGVISPEDFGALGDGVYRTSGSAVAGDATFTATGVSWSVADVGKRIVIMGVGAAGSTLSATITGVNSTTSVELSSAPSTSRAPAASFYYGTNDTVAVQAAANALKDGQSLQLVSGKVYLVDSLTLPSGNGYQPNGHYRGMCASGTGVATIAPTGQGNTDYLVACARWATNSIYATAPYKVSGIRFDAFGLKDLAFVHKMYASTFDGCTFSNAIVANYRHTRQNSDGSLGTSGFPFGTLLHRCYATGTIPTTYGFHMQGEAGDNSQSPTDGTMIDCSAFGGSMEYGIHFGNTGGWTILGCRTWSVLTGLYIYMCGKNAVFQGNNWDTNNGVAVRVGSVGTYIDFAAFQGDNFYSDLVVDFTNDDTGEVLLVENCHFYFDPTEPTTGIGGDGQARIVHNNNRASKTIRSVGNTAQAANFHQRTAGNTLGVFDVHGHYSVDDAVKIGRRLVTEAYQGPIDRSLHDSASPAVNDALKTEEIYGRDGAGNLTKYAASEYIVRDATDATEDGAWRLSALVGGSLVQRVHVDDRGMFVGKFLATVPGAAHLGQQIVGDSYSTSGQSMSRYSADADGSWQIFFKSRGAVPGVNTIVNSGDTIGRIQWRAADGTTGAVAAEVRAVVDGAPGASDMPGRIVFATTADGASTLTDRITVDSKGAVLVSNATTVPASNPVGGGYLYTEAGALKYRGSSGTVTTVALP